MCNAFIFMEGKNLSTGISENVYKQNHERLWVILNSMGEASTPSDLIGKAVHLTPSDLIGKAVHLVILLGRLYT